MPCDYRRYPPNWKTEIRPRILARAANKCERCGAEHHTRIRRNKENPYIFIPWSERVERYFQMNYVGLFVNRDYRPAITVVLTIAHLDHDPENWEVTDDRLAALCQRCHLEYDKEAKR